MVPVVLVLLITLALTDNMFNRAALLDSRPVVVPVAVTDETCAVTVSVVLISRTERVPLDVNVLLDSVKPLDALSPVSTVMTGAELFSGDRDHYVLSIGRSLTVGRSDGVGQRNRLTRAEVIERVSR